MVQEFYKYADDKEILIDQKVSGNFSGYGKLVRYTENDLIEEYIGFFKDGEIKDGKYIRHNPRMLKKINKEIDDFNNKLKQKKDEGYLVRVKNSGWEQGSNGGNDVRFIENKDKFIDIEFQGTFCKMIPNDNLGKLSLRLISDKWEKVYERPIEPCTSSDYYRYECNYPSIKILNLCGNIEWGRFEDGFGKAYDEKYDSPSHVKFINVNLTHSINFCDLIKEIDIQKISHNNENNIRDVLKSFHLII